MSTERTFSTDLEGIEECRPRLERLFEELLEDLRKRTERRSVERLFVKITFHDFTKTSVERSGREPLLAVYEALLEEGISRGGKAVGLIGVGVRFSEQTVEQLELPLVLG
jgi:DNA polymerase-4